MLLASEILADSPHAYWKLNESSGSTAADSSGNGHDGSYVGGVTLSAEATPDGGAVAFDGVDGHMIVAASGDDWLFPAWTLECWAKFATIPASDNQHPVMTLSFPGTGPLNMAMGFDLKGPGVGDATKLTGGLYNGGWKAAVSSSGLSTNVWHQLVTTWSTGLGTLYVDGVFASDSGATGSGTATPTVNPDFRLARRWDTSGTEQYQACKMQHAAVFPSALSTTRITAHYAAGRQTHPLRPYRTAVARASTR